MNKLELVALELLREIYEANQPEERNNRYRSCQNYINIVPGDMMDTELFQGLLNGYVDYCIERYGTGVP